VKLKMNLEEKEKELDKFKSRNCLALFTFFSLLDYDNINIQSRRV